MTEARDGLPRTSKSGGERVFKRGRTKVQSPTSQFMLDPDRHKPDEPAQLVLDPGDHEANVIKPLLAKMPTSKRVERLFREIRGATYSTHGQPNPLERKGR